MATPGRSLHGDLLPGHVRRLPWHQAGRRTCEIEPNANFVFSHTRNDALIACDHHVENANSYNEEDFPFLTAELGGGLQVTMHRRPVAKGCDVGAMSRKRPGSGAGCFRLPDAPRRQQPGAETVHPAGEPRER